MGGYWDDKKSDVLSEIRRQVSKQIKVEPSEGGKPFHNK